MVTGWLDGIDEVSGESAEASFSSVYFSEVDILAKKKSLMLTFAKREEEGYIEHKFLKNNGLYSWCPKNFSLMLTFCRKKEGYIERNSQNNALFCFSVAPNI